MQNTKHTPGPWNYDFNNDLLTHDGDDVAYLDTAIPERSKAEQRANARLIASAPELLNELEKCANVISHSLSELPEAYRKAAKVQADAARAAITKATK